MSAGSAIIQNGSENIRTIPDIFQHVRESWFRLATSRVEAQDECFTHLL
jgi:hypothetical protein